MHEGLFSIKLMCQYLDVCRSSYYDWRNHCHLARTREDESIMEQITMIFNASRQNYGTRRIKRMLAKKNILVSRRRIGRLMKKMKLTCKTKQRFKPITTLSNHKQPLAANLLNRQFSVDAPDKCYVGDITYLPTLQGWLYLAVVIDLFSRKVVGWAMQDNMQAALVNKALLMAIWSRKPKRGLLWHTDRGSQYAADSHREIIAAHGIVQSMSRKGNCWDNAVSESFFHTLKTELTHHTIFKTKEEARNAIFEYIEVFYNRMRMHSANDYLSPVEFEQARKFN
jgi:putative transposase